MSGSEKVMRFCCKIRSVGGKTGSTSFVDSRAGGKGGGGTVVNPGNKSVG